MYFFPTQAFFIHSEVFRGGFSKNKILVVLYSVYCRIYQCTHIFTCPCRDVALRLVCYYYYPPCGNSTHFLPPNSPCMDTCSYISETVCPDQWMRVLDFLKLPGVSDNVVRLNLFFLNCTNPGAALNQLPHCCSDAGIEISMYCIKSS